MSKEQLKLLWGKLRRLLLALLGKKPRGRRGKCGRCGACCRLLWTCPWWDQAGGRCLSYEKRPKVCRLFPLTPQDIEDRNVDTGRKCGYYFLE